MSRKVFTAGEVLAAADVNSFLMDQTVMSFAGTAARGSAIGTAVEGMYTYLEDSDRLEVYNGTSWVPNNALTLVKQQTIGTGVTLFAVANAFNADYDNYRVIISGLTTNTPGSVFGIAFNNATGSNYFWAYRSQIYDGSNSFAGGNNSAFTQVGVFGGNAASFVTIDICNPFKTAVTTWKALHTGRSNTGEGGGAEAGTNSHTGFDIYMYGPTMTGGIVQVYGYRKN